MRIEMAAIESFEQAKLSFLNLWRRRAAVQIRHRFCARDNPSALMHARQKIGIPHLPASVWQLRCEYDERRQILVFSSKPIADPRTNARPFKRDRAGVNPERRLEMIAVVIAHRVDYANFIDHLA